MTTSSSFILYKKKIDNFYEHGQTRGFGKVYKSKLKESKMIFAKTLLTTNTSSENNYSYENGKFIKANSKLKRENKENKEKSYYNNDDYEDNEDNEGNEDNFSESKFGENEKLTYIQTEYTGYLPTFEKTISNKLIKEHSNKFLKFDTMPRLTSVTEQNDKNKLNRIFQTSIQIPQQSSQTKMNIIYRNGIDKNSIKTLLNSAKPPNSRLYPKFFDKNYYHHVRLYVPKKPNYIQLFSNFINANMRGIIKIQAMNFAKAIKFVKKDINSLFSSK